MDPIFLPNDLVPNQEGPIPSVSIIPGSTASPVDPPSVNADPSSSTPAGVVDVMEAYRPLRKRPHKRGADRGLPTLENRLLLAATYLSEQRQAWPDLVAAGVLPAQTDEVLMEMAVDFERRHVTRVLHATSMSFLQRLILSFVVVLWAVYLRYSCDNSNPRSLDDQLRQILKRARSLNIFIPWCLVFADASVSGADPSREGYGALKTIVEQLPEAAGILIDEFSRAGRDPYEWFRFAFWAKRHTKNIRCASEEFELCSPHGQMMLFVYTMFSDFFLKQLRAKVLCGMKGAAKRKTSVGRPPLGYGLRPQLDSLGRMKMGTDGWPLREKCIHPTTMVSVEWARKCLLDDDGSVGDVITEFNRRKVDGSDGWTDCSVRRVLSNEIYFGFEVYNRTHNEFDSETFQRKTIVNPRKEWRISFTPHLRVWDRGTYRRMRQKIGRVHGRRRLPKGKKTPRVHNGEPKRMLNKLLNCVCGEKLKEVRGGINAAYGCFQGYFDLHNCPMKVAKAATIVEESLLEYVYENVLLPQKVLALFERARQLAQIEAKRPPVDVGPLEAQNADLIGQRERLIDLVAGDQTKTMDAVRERINSIGKQIDLNEIQIAKAKRRLAGPIPALTLADVERYLVDLRGLLAGTPGAAGKALLSITGPITVTHQPYGANERYGGTKGGRWLLTFTPRLLSAIAQIAGNQTKSADLQAQLIETGSIVSNEIASVTLVVDRRKSLQDRLVPFMKAYIGQINPGTGKNYTRKEVAVLLNQKIDVVHYAWRRTQNSAADTNCHT